MRRRGTGGRGGFLALALAGSAVSGCAGGEPEAGPPREGSAPDPVEAAAVLRAAETVLEAITTADGDLLRTVVLPEAQVVAVTEQGMRNSTGAEMAEGISDPEQGYVERMWDPVVQVQGPIAAVWAPYDFYRRGEFSHCGVDAFHLVRVDGAWKVRGLVYNVLQPPACPSHPQGPPA